MKKEEISEAEINTFEAELKRNGELVKKEIERMERENENVRKPVEFDIGIKDTFLEVEQTEEAKQLYDIEQPSELILLVAKILVGLLGKWDLINPEDPSATWQQIKIYFAERMKDNISIV